MSFGAEVAELGLVVAFDDGEGGEDVVGVVPVEAVEVEVEGVEAGSEVAAGSSSQGKGGPWWPRSRAKGAMSWEV